MKITAFNGSPRGPKGNTEVMVKNFLNGAHDSGAEVENIYLSQMNINHCQGCRKCVELGGQCVIEDDMNKLLYKYINSDIVVIATPLMIDNISGMLKVFFDRTFCLGNHRLELDEMGQCRRVRSKLFEHCVMPNIVVMANSGYPERRNFEVIAQLMKRTARNFGMKVIAEIYKSQGILLSSDIKRLRPKIEEYTKLLYQAGGEIVKYSKLLPQTEIALAEDFISKENYFKLLNFIN
ncbi:flavodoxin family protein [Ruminiclostridium josui]|uniref:flavodoxin family protein n=1 Tax=Ruminiclostridium josui TaxID=1499 RepID=UPI000462F948|nr:flavodoxin family protein [Ruminiclostridium josui]